MDQNQDASPSAKRKFTRPRISTIFAILLIGVGIYFLVSKRAYEYLHAVTGKVMSGMQGADRIEAERGSLEGFNVLVVTFDTTRADHLECYGNRGVETPNLNQLAKDGYLMSNCSTVVITSGTTAVVC